MDFVFSKREIARRAAKEAHDRYMANARDSFTGDGARISYWGYVINAALAAIPDPADQVGTRRAMKKLAEEPEP